MRAVLIAVAALLAVPALAQNNKSKAEDTTKVKMEAPPPAQAESFRGPPGGGGGGPNTPGYPSPGPSGTPVVVDREALMRQLAGINEKLAQATGQARKDKQLQRLLDDARAELKEVGRQVTNAPLARMEPSRPPPPPPQPTVQPITEGMLRSLVSAIRNEPFADDQLAVLEQAVPTQYFLVAQAQQLLRVFSFSSDRVKAMRLLRPRLLDLENGFKLYESFDHSSDKDELKRILAAQTP
ncbi:DUF4476 domain-containing protein [Archangium gephyra]|uniref:DUF4476 domain-containing protein n=1 Tax=Archangium gephyra TaxID=48 RepID=UPI0035D4AEF7